MFEVKSGNPVLGQWPEIFSKPKIRNSANAQTQNLRHSHAIEFFELENAVVRGLFNDELIKTTKVCQTFVVSTKGCSSSVMYLYGKKASL